jgi:hypothetical protein
MFRPPDVYKKKTGEMERIHFAGFDYCKTFCKRLFTRLS